MAEIAVENRLWHLIKVGWIPLPHPPVVNLILRRGLPEEERLKLSYLHEFGHLQTFPVALAHATLLLLLGRKRKGSFLDIVLMIAQAVVAHEAVWELASEGYAVARIGPEYRKIYSRYPNLIGQSLFWSGMLGLAAYFTRRLINSGKG
jgi:hypothetical protein